MRIEQIEQIEQTRQLAFQREAIELEAILWSKVGDIIDPYIINNTLESKEFLKKLKEEIEDSLEAVDLKETIGYLEEIFPTNHAESDRITAALMGYSENLKKKFIKKISEAVDIIRNKIMNKWRGKILVDLKEKISSEMARLKGEYESLSNDSLLKIDLVSLDNDFGTAPQEIKSHSPNLENPDINKIISQYQIILSKASELVTYSVFQKNIKEILINYCKDVVKVLKSKLLSLINDWDYYKRDFRHNEIIIILNYLTGATQDFNDEKLIKDLEKFIKFNVIDYEGSDLCEKLLATIKKAENFEVFSLKDNYKHRNSILEEKIQDMQPKLIKEIGDLKKEKDYSAEAKKYVENFDSKKSDNLALSVELKATKETLDKTNIELVNLKSEKESLSSELKKTKESLDEAKKEIENYDSKLESLKSDNESIESELTSTKLSLNQANKKIEDHATEVRELKDAFNAFKSSYAQEKDQHRQEKDQYRKQIEDLLGVQEDYKAFKSTADEMGKLLVALRGQLNSP